VKTFSRATFLEAKAAWDDGDFGWQWQHYRRLAADRGFIFPPAGTKHDDRDVDSPSQRAIIWAAIDENPTELERIIRRSWSWSQVVDQIFGLEARLVDDANESQHDAKWEKDNRPTHREAAMSLGAVLRRLADSA
jgi:hypothetical protein